MTSVSSEADALMEEDEFQDRDATGLQPWTEKTPTEAAEAGKYRVMLLLISPLLGQVFAWSTYLILAKLCGQQGLYDKKFAFIHEFQLGYVYLAIWIIAMARTLLVINANAARAPARVDRPDQHVYKIMAADGDWKGAPYVLMAGTGAQGRFNRAQRGVFNTDESMPLVLANIIVTGLVFGPIIACLALLIGFGRVVYGLKYKESSKVRGAGLVPATMGEKWVEGLVLLCAIKGIFFTSIPM
eukprot:TRINITY_DN16558_c1_g1_i1.p1 TRINITY_DN16558_c1_g1~~TRINITY_DN16558_c1_g1_i1.p1  ORF type:complete len:242 (-),score=37.34 TRINITY_DN16558_c1_g1_i1:138-863(-)